MTTTYAVIDRHGETKGTDLSARDAAEIVLYDDGQDYEIRSDALRSELWTRQEVANRPWQRTTVTSYDADERRAADDIFTQVLKRGLTWGGFTVHTMDQHRKMLADLAADGDDA